MTETQIADHLDKIAKLEDIEVEDGVTLEVARRARGGLRDAQSLFDQLITMGAGRPALADLAMMTGGLDRDRLAELFGTFVAPSEEADSDQGPRTLLNLCHQILDGGASVVDVLDELIGYVRDMIALKSGVDLPGHSSPECERMKQLGSDFDLDALLAMSQVLLQGRARLKEIDDARLILELTLLKIQRIGTTIDLGAALSYLRRLRVSPGSAEAPARGRSTGKPAPRSSRPATSKEPAKRGSGSKSPPAKPPSLGDLDDVSSGDDDQTKGPAEKPNPVPRDLEGAELKAVFQKILDTLNKRSRSLGIYVAKRFEAVKLRAGRLEVTDVTPDEPAFYDLGKPPHNEVLSAVIDEVMGPGIRWVAVEASVDRPAKPSVPKIVDRAKELFDGDIVSE